MIKSDKWNLYTAKYALREMQETATREFGYKLNKKQLKNAITNFDSAMNKEEKAIYYTAYISVINLFN